MNEVTVIGTDYAFEIPESLAAGPTELAFENRGAVEHEVAIGLLKEGFTMDQVLQTEQAGGDAKEMIDEVVGILIASPGESAGGRIRVDLLPGRTYAMICSFKDAEDAPPHTALGMYASFVVR